ncbi:MAG: hypothetical protein Q9182_001853 [Xanthomendoza sp. 2 TL-2023]
MPRQQSHARFHYVTLDVFTNERFKGNPLAIVDLPVPDALDQTTKQKIAREFNFSETVFLHGPGSGLAGMSSHAFDIFTTTEELPFAGHPTIGTIFYLCSENDHRGKDQIQSITLKTKAGPIRASYNSQTTDAEASIPHNVHIHQTPVPWQSVLKAQASLTSIGSEFQTASPLISLVKGMSFVLINLPQLEDLNALAVGGPGLEKSSITWDEGWESFTVPYFYVIVSEDKEARHVRLRVRMIEPTSGEDPATGSAASGLSVYLALQRGAAGSTYSFSIEQGVEMGRHSDIGVKVTLDFSGHSVKDVVLSGSAILVSEGFLYL